VWMAQRQGSSRTACWNRIFGIPVIIRERMVVLPLSA